eukprot:TRINITY_DN25655_c0_g1_i2.p1 TRINITY_DN25655_c0_g1~~TRINITY_DN25655_c0_g1_i2.p1  ORF type:complete len:633 (+),score=22.71 TRINITY_DN25655_c0_g1_i2:72-1901(+)
MLRSAVSAARSQEVSDLRLMSTLPGEMIRGIPRDIALQGYGRHWKGSSGATADYMLSEDTQCIDDFISHDWRTSRTAKYVALCYIYNGKAAVVGSVLIAAVLVLIKELAWLAGFPEVAGTQRVQLADCLSFVIVGPIAFFGLFFHWHDVLAALGYTKLLFVDKLCICQQDEEMKAQGILGLAAFLKHSRRLVVLWSPTYLSRLWCTYELATWFRYNNYLSSVLFVPVEIPLRLLVGVGIMTVTCIAHYVFTLLAIDGQHLIGPSMAISLLCWVMASYVFHGHLWHVSGLRPELENFSVQQTSCFCCSNNHRHPDTLQEWTGSSGQGEQPDEHLSIFNTEVRTTLKEYVTGVLPERHLFVRYQDILFTTTPWLLFVIDFSILGYRRGDAHIWLNFVSGLASWFLAMPLSLNILLRMMYATYRRVKVTEKSRQVTMLLSCCVWGPIGCALYNGLFMLVRGDLHSQLEGAIWPFVAAAILELVLTCCAFANNWQQGMHLAAATFSLATVAIRMSSSGSVQTATRTMSTQICGSPSETSAAAALSLREAACEQKSSRQGKEKDGIDVAEVGICIPFDEAWLPVAEENNFTLTALGPVYMVDLGCGETGSVISL